jgi:hypothetical protein
MFDNRVSRNFLRSVRYFKFAFKQIHGALASVHLLSSGLRPATNAMMASAASMSGLLP